MPFACTELAQMRQGHFRQIVNLMILLKKMVGGTGIEPVTLTMSR